MKLKRAALLCLFGASFLYADNPDYAAWIGMDPAGSHAVFGPPSHIYVHRGERAEEDNVVFYRDGIYLFWFENRIWQIRADRNSDAALAGIGIGDTRDRVIAMLGEALYTEADGSLYFEISRRSYPLRLRVVLDSGDTVEDLYLYRGDY